MSSSAIAARVRIEHAGGDSRRVTIALEVERCGGPMSLTLAFDTATADTAVAVCDGSEALAERRARPRRGRPAQPWHGAARPRRRARSSEAGGWERVEADRRRHRPRLLHRDPDRRRDGAGAGAGDAACRVAGVPTTAALAAGHRGRGGAAPAARLSSTRAAASSSRRVLRPGAAIAGPPARARAGSPWSGLFQAADGAVGGGRRRGTIPERARGRRSRGSRRRGPGPPALGSFPLRPGPGARDGGLRGA